MDPSQKKIAKLTNSIAISVHSDQYKTRYNYNIAVNLLPSVLLPRWAAEECMVGVVTAEERER